MVDLVMSSVEKELRSIKWNQWVPYWAWVKGGNCRCKVSCDALLSGHWHAGGLSVFLRKLDKFIAAVKWALSYGSVEAGMVLWIVTPKVMSWFLYSSKHQLLVTVNEVRKPVGWHAMSSFRLLRPFHNSLFEWVTGLNGMGCTSSGICSQCFFCWQWARRKQYTVFWTVLVL